MALTAFQRDVCKIISQQRLASGESYIAGGAALNVATGSDRVSDDVDIFHDSWEAVEASCQLDCDALRASQFAIQLAAKRIGMMEAVVSRGDDRVILQWTSDSAYRFFPLVEHEEFGLALHPFDLATNKVLALIGRAVVRDWVDVIVCDKSLQSFGYLAWAASGKDPGFGPRAIIEYATRSRYTQEEVDKLDFIGGKKPDAAELSRRWHAMVDEARELVLTLPAEESGKCVLHGSGTLFNGGAEEFTSAFRAGEIHFHNGCLRGAFPQIKPQ